MAGSDVLRLEILELLDAFRARLAVIGACSDAAASPPARRPSTIADSSPLPDG